MSGLFVLAAPAILLPYQLLTAVSLIYSISGLEAHQAAVLKKFKQIQWVETFMNYHHALVPHIEVREGFN